LTARGAAAHIPGMPRSFAWTSLRLCSATAFALALAPLAACGEEEVEDAGLTNSTASGSGSSTTGVATGTESDTSGASTSTTGTSTSTSGSSTSTSTTGTPTTGTSSTTGTTGTTGTSSSTSGGANCGNGTIDQGEQCDGSNLGSFTRCEQITATEVGPLACDPMTCMYDLSMCMAGGTTGATGG
jgi:hypothetical protein